MEVLEAFDLTGSLRDAARLAGCSHHTVARYVAAREAGGQLDKAAARPQLIEEYLPKVQEWVKNSKGTIRADKAHEKLLALGFNGSERTTRRAVHEAKAAFNLGQVRVHRPWVTEPATGILVVYIAVTGLGAGDGSALAVLTVAGVTSLGWMSVVNFMIRSDFRWALLVLDGVWGLGLLLAATAR